MISKRSISSIVAVLFLQSFLLEEAFAFQGEKTQMCFADTLLPNVETKTQPTETFSKAADSIAVLNAEQLKRQQAAVDTLKVKASLDSMKTAPAKATPAKKIFRPDPQRALWLALVFPGGGQIYNRKYWKLPIIYGGFLGCTYALMWNQGMYKDYSQAYLDIMDDDPNTKSYEQILPPRYKIEGNEEQFKRIFKNKKDYYRRYRDLSAFAFIGVYILSVVDAYVDASLSEFDISRDLSLQVEPAAIRSKQFNRQRTSVGLQCNLKF